MPISSGTRLGPYEIMAPAGAGGMGEVYRARDTRLDRIVAIKVLSTRVADSPHLRERFEREARALSSLSHAHICTLYDIGFENGTDFLVMEYLEGETLAARIARGPLSTQEVMRYGAEIADALDKAHRQGVIHRDLKPGNIVLTKSGAKLLDFGLAKANTNVVAAAVSQMTQQPTQAQPLTAEGTILGTLEYMAPEQLEGKEADARTDIFALGTVLYEMATGRKAFMGKSQATIIAAILSSEPPPLHELLPLAPPALEHTVCSCLEKDPEERWQSAHDVVRELQWLSTTGAAAAPPVRAASPSRRRTLGWIATGVLLLVVMSVGGTVIVLRLRERPEQFPVGHFVISLPQKVTFLWNDFPVISPNGEYVAFAASWPDGKRQLWVRKLDSLTAEALPGTEGASTPFWSPDSKSIAFAAHGMLEKIDLAGGSPQTLCDVPCGLLTTGGDWNHDGAILTDSPDGRLYRLAAAGGQTVPIAEPDRSRQETALSVPRFLPDGRHFFYAANSPIPAHQAIYVGSLDSKERKLLVNANSVAAYMAPGYLMYVRGGLLVAQPFDLGRLQLSGDAFPVSPVGTIGTLSLNSLGTFSVSRNGVLASLLTGGFNSELAWYDRYGRRLTSVGAAAFYTNPALSPDSKRLAVSIGEPNKNREIWIFDLVRGNASPFTFNRSDNLNPVWSRDGSQILFTSNSKGYRDIYEKAANGLGATQPVIESAQFKSVNDWSPDGRYIVYDTGSGGALWVLPMFGERKPSAFVEGGYTVRQAEFSPNGHYIAYASAESGTNQVYVQTFPEHQGKWQISTNGGVQPRWRADGKELFYLAGTKMTAVDVNTASPGFQVGVPKPLFDTPPVAAPSTVRSSYVVTPDGQRFLFAASLQQTASSFDVLVNLPTLLKK